MNAELYFKDKIDWKIFNLITDICTSKEDEGGSYLLNVAVCVSEDLKNDIISYKPFYFSKNGYGGFDAGNASSNILRFIEAYEKRGLFFILFLDAKEDDYIINKLRNSKKLEWVKERDTTSGKKEYIIKPL